MTLAGDDGQGHNLLFTNIMKHKHSWCCHPPEGQLRWGKSWEENEWDEEAMSENNVINSEEYQMDLLLSLEDDPSAREDEFWPELTEWCSLCKKTRKVKFDWKVGGEKEVRMKDSVEEVMIPEQIDEVAIIGDSACSKYFKMQLEIAEPLEEEKKKEVLVDVERTTTFWRPWEFRCEATAEDELSCEATSLLSHQPVTPPLLVTPPCRRTEEFTPGRRMGRNMKRLLDFQATLEKERGLPQSQWLASIERGEATPPPVSHRRRSRRERKEVVDAEANSPNLGDGSGELKRVQCPILPLVDSFSDGVTASRSNLSMLHTTSLAPACWQKRAFCCGCGSWGNMIPMT